MEPGNAFPLDADISIDPSIHPDELVVFEDAQTCPLFIFTLG